MMLQSNSISHYPLGLPSSSALMASSQPSLNMVTSSMHSYYPRFPGLAQREKFIRNVYKEYLDPIFSPDGDTLLAVECGENRGVLHLSRFCQGSKGPCIRFDDMWWTPNEFQYVSGRESAKDWKRSIRHQGKSLKLLIAKGILAVHPSSCSCTGCRISSPVNRGKLAGYNGRYDEGDSFMMNSERNNASPPVIEFDKQSKKSDEEPHVDSRIQSVSNSPKSTASTKSVIGSLLERHDVKTEHLKDQVPYQAHQFLYNVRPASFQEEKIPNLNMYESNYSRLLQMQSFSPAKPLILPTPNFSMTSPFPAGLPQQGFSGMNHFDLEHYQRSLYRQMSQLYQGMSSSAATDFQSNPNPNRSKKSDNGLPGMCSVVGSPKFTTESLISDNSDTSSTPPGIVRHDDKRFLKAGEESPLDLTIPFHEKTRSIYLSCTVKPSNPPPSMPSKGLFGNSNRYSPYTKPDAAPRTKVNLGSRSDSENRYPVNQDNWEPNEQKVTGSSMFNTVLSGKGQSDHLKFTASEEFSGRSASV